MYNIEQHIKDAEERRIFPDDLLKMKYDPNALVTIAAGYNINSNLRTYNIGARGPGNTMFGEHIRIECAPHECEISPKLGKLWRALRNGDKYDALKKIKDMYVR